MTIEQHRKLRNEFIERRKRGETWQMIGDVYRMTAAGAFALVKRFGQPKAAKKARFTPEQIYQIRQMRAAGSTIHAIEIAFKSTYKTIYAHVEDIMPALNRSRAAMKIPIIIAPLEDAPPPVTRAKAPYEPSTFIKPLTPAQMMGRRA